MSTPSSSSTSQSLTNSSTTTNLPPQEVYMQQYVPVKQTPAQMRIAGEIKIKLAILITVGVICLSLIVIGGVVIIREPRNANNVWVIIGPIITAAVTGIGAYFQGERNGQRK